MPKVNFTKHVGAVTARCCCHGNGCCGAAARGAPRAALAGERYLLTDFRLLRTARDGLAELALDDIGEIQRTESPLDRLLGTSTIAVHPRRDGAPLRLTGGPPRARSSPRCSNCSPAIRARRAMPTPSRAALAWEPRTPSLDLRGALAGFVGVLIAIVARRDRPARHHRRGHATRPTMRWRRTARSAAQAEIIAFMETEVMPWARATLGPSQGRRGSRHLRDLPRRRSPTRGWRMPAVAALPQPDVRDRGWEIYQTDDRRANA